MHRYSYLALLVLLLTMLSGCRPSAHIESPDDGDTFDSGETIYFSASATDIEDGDLPDSALVWTSDIDGTIGRGVSFSSDNLTAGAHTITLTATDSDGEEDTDIIEITIEPADNQTGTGRRARLKAAETWMYQIGMLDESGAVEALAVTDYPLLVLEPGHNHRPCSDDFTPQDFGIPQENRDDACADVYSTRSMLSALRKTPAGDERLLIAYIDIGQAEWYRDYWIEGWAPPTATSAGTPDFILAADPDGWLGNFVVRYWDTAWQDIWLGTQTSDGIITELARLGFDGVYLDWVEAYDDDRVQDEALKDGVDAAEEMGAFIKEIGDTGRAVTQEFLVIAQNATFLIDEFDDPTEYTDTIDALAVEDTWYYGNGSSENWNDGDGDVGPWDISDRLTCEQQNCTAEITGLDTVCPNEDETETCLETYPVSGDLHGGTRHTCPEGTDGTPNCWSTENRLSAYERYLAQGVPVFTVDYCISEDKADRVYKTARSKGLRPLVTRVQLSRNTETPPSDFK